MPILSASLCPAISEKDLLNIPVRKIPEETSKPIISHIRRSHAARREAQQLLEKAKRTVEIAIEEWEERAQREAKGGPA